MTSASKFIDFFVHDILDYTLLNKNAKNFIKNMTVFDIKTCVNEIIEIQEDKIKMKSITIKTSFKGFKDKNQSQDLLVKTD